jgi:hypothetical protein
VSWFIKKVGSVPAVRLSIQNDVTLPEAIQAALLSVLQDEKGYESYNGVIVEGSGHTYGGPGEYMSGINSLKVERVPLSQ